MSAKEETSGNPLVSLAIVIVGAIIALWLAWQILTWVVGKLVVIAFIGAVVFLAIRWFRRS